MANEIELTVTKFGEDSIWVSADADLDTEYLFENDGDTKIRVEAFGPDVIVDMLDQNECPFGHPIQSSPYTVFGGTITDVWTAQSMSRFNSVVDGKARFKLSASTLVRVAAVTHSRLEF